MSVFALTFSSPTRPISSCRNAPGGSLPHLVRGSV
nr:MAG TPA: hypothetical protein [Caudoviricetes sp.]